MSAGICKQKHKFRIILIPKPVTSRIEYDIPISLRICRLIYAGDIRVGGHRLFQIFLELTRIIECIFLIHPKICFIISSVLSA